MNAILLRSSQTPVQIDAEDVYFAFADGRFDYDCITCGAQCCRGHGYNIQRGAELETHLTARPAVRFFLEPVGSSESSLRVTNCVPACFFLDSGGLCTLQVRYSYEAKPEGCRLFPFNNIARAGHALIVSPHPSLCPLRVLPPGATSERSQHAALREALSRGGISAEIPEVSPTAGNIRDALELERTVLQLSEEYLTRASGFNEFVAAQVAVLRLSGNGPQHLDDVSAERSVTAFEKQMLRMIGYTPAAEYYNDPALTRTLIASTPAVRAMVVFARKTDKHAAIELRCVPYALLAWRVFGALALEAGLPRVTYQSLMRIFLDHWSVIALLAHATLPMAWKKEANIELQLAGERQSQQQYLRIAQALLPRRQQRIREPLGEILIANCPDGVDRILFLKRLANRLARRIERVSSAPPGRVHVGAAAAKRAVGRWMLGSLDSHTLAVMGERLCAHSSEKRNS